MAKDSDQKSVAEEILEALSHVGVRPFHHEETCIQAVIHFAKSDDCIYLESSDDDGCHLTVFLHSDWLTLANDLETFGENFPDEAEHASALLTHARSFAESHLRSLLRDCKFEQCGPPHKTPYGLEYVFYLQKCDSCADILRQFFKNADSFGRILRLPPEKSAKKNESLATLIKP